MDINIAATVITLAHVYDRSAGVDKLIDAGKQRQQRRLSFEVLFVAVGHIVILSLNKTNEKSYIFHTFTLQINTAPRGTTRWNL